MVGIFKANNPLNPFILFIYGILLKLGWFLHPGLVTAQQTDGFLFKEIINRLQPAAERFPIIYPAITYVLLFLQAIAFTKLISDQKLFQRSNYLPAMSYLLITSLFAEWNVLSAPLVINTLLIWVWARMSSLYNNNNAKSTLYNIGIAIGVSTFFYFPALAFALLVVFALIVTRPFKISEWLVAILGIITPYYFFIAWLFLTDKLYSYKMPALRVSAPVFQSKAVEWIAMGALLLAFLIGIYYIQVNLRKQLVQVRKSWNLILFYLIVAVFIPFINATKIFEYCILTALPLSAFIAAAFFYPLKKWLPIVLHWLFVALVIIISYNLA